MIKKILPKSAYAKNVLTLMTGTGLAQAIPIAISPILTRIYSPEEFGVFALYMAITSILTVLVTGRYEMAILLPKKDRDAMNLVALAIALSFFVSVILLIVVAVFNSQIIKVIGVPELSMWLYWIPASTFLMGVYQSLNYWSNRKSHYRRLAISRVLQSSGTGAVQLAGAFNNIGVSGLVGGQLIGQTLSTAVLGSFIYKEDKENITRVKRLRIVSLARKYINFPKFLIVAHGFNTASGQVPIFLLSSLFNSASAGFFMLSQRVMGAPMTLIASAIGDVFRQEASYAYVNTGSCKNVYTRTFKKLLMISIVPSIIFFFIAPDLFEMVFGEQWRVAGEYAQILTPMYFFKFVTSPVSQVSIYSGKQKIDLLWQIVLFFMTVFSMYIGAYLSDIKLAFVFFSAIYSFMYIVSGYINYIFSKGGLDVEKIN
ncbi:lipopolysaccharide biosynthesis protein [Oceanisphaera ostreae]|uniref:Lipopolysaccharide biosynthesis protein n=1 Tax=Oceanisphaera ostreae TaxID=914151 RepID=A0ABW3KE09_9GAMM